MYEKSTPAHPQPSGPACQHLRSKGMYVTGMLNPAEEHAEIGDGHCWCNLNQNVIGPDDNLVSREGCQPGRTCYQPII